MRNAAIQLVGSVALGVYVLVFARSTFGEPERIRQDWFSQLPEREWSARLLRIVAVFWMFGGFLLIANGFVTLPFLDQYRGFKLLTFDLIIAAALTALLAANTPRRKWSKR
jgi:hypothetical protein